MNWEELYSIEDPWKIRGDKLLLKRVKEMKNLANKIKLQGLLLDGGCGEEHITYLTFKDFGVRFVGLDISHIALSRARKKNIQGDTSSLPFRDEVFDFVLLSESIYYTKNWKQCLDEAWRVLKYRGYILVSVALERNYLGYWVVNRDFKRRFRHISGKIAGTSIFRTIIKIAMIKIAINHPHYAKYLILGQKV